MFIQCSSKSPYNVLGNTAKVTFATKRKRTWAHWHLVNYTVLPLPFKPLLNARTRSRTWTDSSVFFTSYVAIIAMLLTELQESHHLPHILSSTCITSQSGHIKDLLCDASRVSSSHLWERKSFHLATLGVSSRLTTNLKVKNPDKLVLILLIHTTINSSCNQR